MRLSELLFERREDVVKALSRYKDRDDIFVSFRSIPKLGINPQSTYNTPIGVYAYPLRVFWDAIEMNEIPFAGSADYAVVFQATGNFADADATAPHGYTQEMWGKDFVTIRQRYLERYRLAHSKLFADHTWGNESKYIEKAIAILQADPTESKAFKNPAWAEHMINGKMDLKDPQLVADVVGSGYLTQDTINKIAALAREFDEGVVMPAETARIRFDQEIMGWGGARKHNSPAAMFWNVTRNLALLLTQIRKSSPRDFGIERRAAIIWNAIMRDLGYDGFTDVTGTGLIHENEPIQAVFFSTQTLKLIEVLPNIRKLGLAEKKVALDNFTFFLNWLRNTEVEYEDRHDLRRVKFWIDRLVRQWPELRRTGKSENFQFGITPQQLEQEILQVPVHFVRGMLTASPRFLPAVLAEVLSEPKMQQPFVWDEVLIYVNTPEVRYLKLLLSPKVVALHAKMRDVTPEQAHEALSEKVIAHTLNTPALRKLIFTSMPESLELAKRLVAPLRRLVNPTLLADEKLEKHLWDLYQEVNPF